MIEGNLVTYISLNKQGNSFNLKTPKEEVVSLRQNHRLLKKIHLEGEGGYLFLIYLEVSETKREKISYLLVHPPNTHNSQGPICHWS